MDKKLFVIGVLSLSAVVLFAANLLQPRVAHAEFVVKENDYTAVTARTRNGAESLYIVENRTGKVRVFEYVPNRRAVEPITPPRLIMDAFAGAAGAGGARGGRNN